MSELVNTATPTEAEQKQEPAGFIDAAAVAERLGVSIGTIRNWTNAGALPAIKLNCGRLVRYDWPSVREAMLRQQRNGQ